MPEEPKVQEPEPGATEPKPVEPKPAEPGVEPEPIPENLLEMKLEGDKVPEKFRGKTITEVIQSYDASEAEKTKAEAEIAQWVKYTQMLDMQEKTKTGETVPAKEAPWAKLDKDLVDGVVALNQAQMQPMMVGISTMLKEFAKSVNPDFEQFEKRATEVYYNLPPEYQFSPSYGWNFALKFAKAEAMGTSPPPGPVPPVPGKSQDPPVRTSPEALTVDQEAWRKKMGMSEEAYRKYGKMIPGSILKEKK